MSFRNNHDVDSIEQPEGRRRRGPNHLRACAVRVRVVHRDDLSVARGLSRSMPRSLHLAGCDFCTLPLDAWTGADLVPYLVLFIYIPLLSKSNANYAYKKETGALLCMRQPRTTTRSRIFGGQLRLTESAARGGNIWASGDGGGGDGVCGVTGTGHESKADWGWHCDAPPADTARPPHGQIENMH